MLSTHSYSTQTHPSSRVTLSTIHRGVLSRVAILEDRFKSHGSPLDYNVKRKQWFGSVIKQREGTIEVTPRDGKKFDRDGTRGRKNRSSIRAYRHDTRILFSLRYNVRVNRNSTDG